MTTLEIFDPPMCCSTGVCGPDPDPRLPQFAADLAWLTSQGVRVTRYNLAREPAAFTANPRVKRLLEQWGPSCLPLVLREETIVARGRYPTRRELAALAGISLEEGS
jgi:Arsenical resistance operon protein ArsD